jgi:hypothetical protein
VTAQWRTTRDRLLPGSPRPAPASAVIGELLHMLFIITRLLCRPRDGAAPATGNVLARKEAKEETCN